MEFGCGPFRDGEDLWRELTKVEDGDWPIGSDPALAQRSEGRNMTVDGVRTHFNLSILGNESACGEEERLQTIWSLEPN